MRTTHTVRKITEAGRRPYYRITIDNRQHYLGTDQAKAYRRAAKLIGDAPPPDQPEGVTELIDAWNRAHPHPRNDEFTKPWRGFAGPEAIEDLAPNGLRKFVAYLLTRDLGQWTILKYYGYARRICAWAVEQGWLDEMPKLPAKKCLRPPPAIPRDYQQTDLAATFNQLPRRAGRLLRFILETGCRPGEARRLRWEQVDLDNAVCVLARHKTESSGLARTIMLAPYVVELLREIGPARTGWVFPSPRTGEPYTKGGLYAIMRRAGLRHGCTSIYGLRHTHAQSLFDQGAGMGQVAEWLGHRDLRTVQTYVKVRRRHLRPMAEALRPTLTLPLYAEIPSSGDGSASGTQGRRRARPAGRGSSPRRPASGTNGTR